MSRPRMLDANICIAIARGKRPDLLKRFTGLKEGDVVISSIVYGELLLGVEKSVHPARTLEKVNYFVSAAPVMPLDSQVAAQYAKIRASLESTGQVIGTNDLWIAAHAVALNLILVTNNVREFNRVPGLKLESW